MHQTELQQRARPGEEVEPRARHLGAALEVDQAERLAKLHMVFRVVDGPGLTDGVEHHEVVFTAGRDTIDDDVGDRHMRCGESLFGIGLLGLGCLDHIG